MLAGSAGGQLKGDRHLVYPKETPLNNLFLNMFDMAGLPHVDGFGDSTGRLALDVPGAALWWPLGERPGIAGPDRAAERMRLDDAAHLVARRHDGTVEAAFAEPMAEHRRDHAAVLAPSEDLRILAAGGDDPPVASEDAFVHTGLLRQHLVAHVELTDAEPGADLGADVAPDTLADAAVVEGGRGLGDLLRLAVDVGDHVVRADEDARPALAAAPERHDLVHHLLEGRVRHGADLSRALHAESTHARQQTRSSSSTDSG